MNQVYISETLGMLMVAGQVSGGWRFMVDDNLIQFTIHDPETFGWEYLGYL